MPEGPEIRRAADRLADVLVGHEVRKINFAFPELRRYERRLRGERIDDVETRGKALLTHFGNGLTIYSHNQLYGVWNVVKRDHLPATGRSLRLAIHTAQHTALLYSASDISVWSRDALSQHPFLAGLGPDLFARDLDWKQIASRMRAEPFARRSLGSLYLDQRFLAGNGNYLRSEILYCAGLHPRCRPVDLSRGECGALARETLAVAKRSYETGGITLTPRLAQSLQKRAPDFERRRFFVFAREGKACYHCGSKVRRDSMGSRRIYWCPKCQPERDPR